MPHGTLGATTRARPALPLMLSASLLVLVGAFAGGLVSGLTGFSTGMTALPIWLVGLTPALASPLVVICSLIGPTI